MLVVRDFSLPLVALSLSALSSLSLSFSVRIIVSSLSFPSLTFPVPPSLSALVSDVPLSAVSFSESGLMWWLPVAESPHELVWALMYTVFIFSILRRLNLFFRIESRTGMRLNLTRTGPGAWFVESWRFRR